MKYLEMFSGIGAFSQAVKELGLDWECVGYSEIDKYAIQIYQKHFPTHINLGDITKINPLSLPDFDLIVGGSPCQDLSIAKNNRKGLDGERSGLFWDFLSIIKLCHPKYFLLENVNSMPKEAKALITKEMGVEPVMIDAALVSAQSRKRLFWCNWNVSQPQDRGILLKDILESGEVDRDKSRTIASSIGSPTDREYFKKHQGQMVYLSQKEINYMNRETSKGRNHFDFGYMHDTAKDKAQTITANLSKGVPYNVLIDRPIRIGDIGGKGQGQRVYSDEGKSVAQSANGGGQGAKTGLYDIDSVIRKLTPIECERLQCFPDDYTAGISNTQRYKCLGNAFNIEVIKHIIAELKT